MCFLLAIVASYHVTASYAFLNYLPRLSKDNKKEDELQRLDEKISIKDTLP